MSSDNYTHASNVVVRHNPSSWRHQAIPKPTITGPRWILICTAVFSANILYGLDTTIAGDIQAAVLETFDNVTQLGWLGVGFTLVSTVAILPLGKAFGMFDVKWVFIGCLTMFWAASALNSMHAFIVGRVWAGAEGAGARGCAWGETLNLVTIMSTPKKQPFYGCILGPIVGGSLADISATWRWAFYLNLVIFGAMSPIYLFALPSLPRRPDTLFAEKLLSLYWVGIVLNGALYVSFTLASTFGGSIWNWNDGRSIACVVWYSFLTSPMDRIFPCGFLRTPHLILLYICMACGGAALSVTVYYIPLYFLFVHGDSGTQAAVRLLPFICFYVATILTCGVVMGRTGYHNLWYLGSGLFMTAGAAAMYTVKYDTPAANAGYAVGPALVQPDRVEELIQYLNISQGSNQMIGLTIASCIFQNLGFQRRQAVREKCVDAIIQTIGEVWIIVIAAGAL
ncbi:major facilitator superfamily domain-containing protein [Aspergillus falconensis]